MIKIYFILLFLVISLKLNSQTELPNYIPPSPETQSFFRIQEFTVNHSTGVPSINIPIYTIKSGDLILPISISYDASGRKLADVNGPIATNWSLNAGGLISKTIFGKPDSKFARPSSGMAETNAEINALPADDKFHLLDSYFKSVKEETNQFQIYDTQYDIYNFSVGSYSGNFLFEDWYSDNSREAIVLPQQPLKIKASAGGRGIGNVSIVDPKGTKYNFGGNNGFETAKGTYNISAMNLSKITSADLSHTIDLYYTLHNHSFASNSENYTIIDQRRNVSTDNESSFNLNVLRSTTSEYEVSRLHEIQFEGGSLKVNLENEYDCIASIELKNESGITIKEFIFERSDLDHPTTPGTIYNQKLDAIRVKNKNGVIIQNYEFDYYPVTNFSYNRTKRDWWGYKNGGNNHLLPYYSIYKQSYDISPGYYTVGYGANRLSSNNSKEGMLKSISYPSKGITEFDYESNRYYDEGYTQNAPGLRIKSQINKNYNGQELSRYTYSYSTGEFVNRFKNTPPVEQKIHMEVEVPPNNAPSTNISNSYRMRTISSEINPLMGFLANQPVFYSSVTKYYGDNSNNNGKTVYTYDHKNPSYDGTFPSISINNYGYDSHSWSFNLDSGLPQRYTRRYNYWDNPSLKQEDYYENSGNDSSGNITYTHKKQITYNYESIEVGSIQGLIVKRFLDFPASTPWNTGYSQEYFAGHILGMPVYYCSDYWIEIGRKPLISKLVREINSESEFITNTSYSYNDNFLLSEVSEETSDGKVSTIAYTYPHEYSGTQVYDNMITKNMLDFPIETIKKLNGNSIAYTKTSYKKWMNDLFAPEEVKSYKKNGIIETRLSYNSYDSYGNPLEVSKADGPHIFYLWGYHGQYPIAKIENTTKTALENVLGDLKEVNESDLQSINNLRSSSAFKEAMITTFTYKPLVGMTVMTDPRGRTTTYEYDDFGRLEIVKDHEGKLLEEYQYHYKGE